MKDGETEVDMVAVDGGAGRHDVGDGVGGENGEIEGDESDGGASVEDWD